MIPALDKIGALFGSSIEALIFASCAYLTLSKKKTVTLTEIFLFCFWLSASLNFLSIFLLILNFHFFSVPLEALYPLLIAFILAFGLQLLFFFFFLLSKMFLEKILKIIMGILIGYVLLFTIFLYLQGAKPELRFGDPFLKSPLERPTFYFLIGLIGVAFVFLLTLLWQDIFQKQITWKNLSLLYTYFSLILYGSISFIRVLYFFPRPWIIEIFYFFVPYLLYLKNKEEEKQNEKN
jgi:hypothetical protein